MRSAPMEPPPCCEGRAGAMSCVAVAACAEFTLENGHTDPASACLRTIDAYRLRYAGASVEPASFLDDVGMAPSDGNRSSRASMR